MLSNNHPASFEFLQKYRPGGPWIITFISVDQKSITTKTYRQEGELLKDLKKYSDRNVYFSVNPTLRDVDKKAKREDIAAVTHLHIDLDPRAGRDSEKERERAQRVLESPPNGIPPASIIIDSGGGFQGFWILKDPIKIDGKLPRAEDAKRYNLQLEVVFMADNCHNIDRIMRLPGTVNLPNAKKRAKGRVPALAKLIKFDEGRVYKISEFQKAPEIQAEGETGFSGPAVKISGNIRRLTSVEDLPGGVSEKVKVLIVQGHDPDDQTKYDSRSEVLFYVCLEMVRAGCTDDEIYAVITDPDFGISESVLDKGSGTERYALRQIERAREEAFDPNLRMLNEKHAVIGNFGGRCVIVEEVMDHAMGRTRLTKQSFGHFKDRYSNIKIEVGQDRKQNPIRVPLGKWWLDQEKRRQYETIVFVPGKEIEGAYNLWKGFAVEARPGDCSLFLDHLKTNVCGGNEDHYDYLIKWMALAVQRPDQPGYTAVVLRGRQGTGKSFFAKMFGSLWGRHFLHVTDPKHLTGSFNAHRRDCVVLFADEAFWAGDKKHESVLKGLITEEMFQVEHKGVDPETAMNFAHLIMASNEDWVVPAGADDRRFFGLDVADEHARDEDYFRAIAQQLDEGGREALLHHLLGIDLKDFDVREVPKTAMLRAQTTLSYTAEQAWWYEKLQEGKLDESHDAWTREIPLNTLIHDFSVFTRQINSRSTSIHLRHFLDRALPKGFPVKRQRNKAIEAPDRSGNVVMIKRPFFYLFPSLEDCRRFWDEKHGGPFEWDEPEQVPDEPEGDAAF